MDQSIALVVYRATVHLLPTLASWRPLCRQSSILVSLPDVSVSKYGTTTKGNSASLGMMLQQHPGMATLKAPASSPFRARHDVGE